MSNRGFTLLETLIYIALFGLLMSGAIVGVYNLLEGGARTTDAAAIQEEGTFLSRKISWALSGASAVAIGGGGSTLSITRPDLGVQSPLLIAGASNAVTISRGGSVAVQLTNDRFAVTALTFVHTAASGGRPASVATSFVVQGQPFAFKTYLRQ